MESKLRIEQYRELLKNMHVLCDIMPEVILKTYFDRNKYLYSLYFESFNSIKGVCLLLGNGGLITQAAPVLRMAIEQTSTIKVLESYKNLQEEYIEHRKLRFEIKDKSTHEKRKLVKNRFKERMDSSDNKKALEYLEYGWLKPINGKYGFDSLIEISKIQEQDDAIKNWKNQLNLFVHGSIELANLTSSTDGPTEYSHVLILIAAKLLDIIIVEFHNDNKFDFIINGFDYRNHFLEAYRAIHE